MPAPRMKIGTDTELFVGRVETKDEKAIYIPQPICGLIGGDKEHPIPIPGLPPGFAMLEDNVTLEFNTPPAYEGYELSEYVMMAITQLSRHIKPKGLSVLKSFGALEYPDLEERLTAERKWPGAFLVGCSEDYWAYSEDPDAPRTKFKSSMFGTNRFAGMHFHVSFENPHNIPNWVWVRFIDLFINIPCMELNVQGSRDSFYGLPGLYRPTKYPDGSSGIEYRSFSNAIAFNPQLITTIAQGIMNLIADINKHPTQASAFYSDIDWFEVQNIVNGKHLDRGLQIYEETNKATKEWHRSIGWWNSKAEKPDLKSPFGLNAARPQGLNEAAIEAAVERIRAQGRIR